MKTDFFSLRLAGGLLAAALIAGVATYSPPTAAETRFAAPDGRAGNGGRSRGDAWDAQSCFERLSPGDTCIYLRGNYGETRFTPQNSGQANARIVHECEELHACRFDRIVLNGVSYLTVKNIASDTHYHDRTKSYVNPRMALQNAHNLKFDSIFVRGEPQICADGNPGDGCESPSPYNRYNDLVRVGNPNDPSETAWKIEITGRTELIDGNHAVIQMFDDDDAQDCEPRESDVWIHGTPEVPIKMSSQYHHILSFKGTCRVLVEHVDFGPAGTGRGDLRQPDNGGDDQAGGILHTSSAREIIVRYSNFSRGGSASSEARNNSHLEVGMFGDSSNGACFAHNSHYQPWGTFAVIGRLNDVRTVQNVSILNNAMADGWHMQRTNNSAATSPYRGFAIARTGQGDFVQVDIDGIVVSSTGDRTRLYSGLRGRERDFDDSVSYIDGIQFGSALWSTRDALFRGPGRWDFSPRAGSLLIGNAAPIATTTSAGNGRTVPVNRAECFAGSMNGLRNGDTVDIGGAHCSVVDTNLADGTIECRQPISWPNNAAIFYKRGNTLVRDIGSTLAGGVTPTAADDSSPPKAPSLTIE